MFSFLKSPNESQHGKISFLGPVTEQKESRVTDLLSIFKFKQVARRAAVGAAIGAVIEEAEEVGGKQGPQGPKRKEAPFFWEDHLARLNDQEFQLRYRLSKVAFRELLELLRADLLQRNVQKAKNS